MPFPTLTTDTELIQDTHSWVSGCLLVARFLRIDLMVSGSNPPLAKLSLRVSRQLSVISGVAIPGCGQIERKDVGTAR